MLEHDYLKYWKMENESIIVDLGATYGDFGKAILPDLKSTKSKLFCVEPAPFAVRELCNWVQGELYKNIVVLSTGVGTETTHATFTECNAGVLNHMESIPQNFPNTEVSKFIAPTIDLVTLLSIVSDKDNLGIDFIKCDIEGAELEFFVDAVNNDLYDFVDHMAIASYHIVDGEPTWKTLLPYFKNLGMEVIHEFVEGDAFSDMLYVRWPR